MQLPSLCCTSGRLLVLFCRVGLQRLVDTVYRQAFFQGEERVCFFVLARIFHVTVRSCFVPEEGLHAAQRLRTRIVAIDQ